MYVVTIDMEKCEGCEDCIQGCPQELIALAEEGGKQYAMFKGDPEECIGCYACESTCGEGAITITEV